MTATAKILGVITENPKVDADYLQKITNVAKSLDDGIIDVLDIDDWSMDILSSLVPDALGHSLYATMWVGPHKDGVIGDITLGVVITGDHYLFTEDNERVGHLGPGTIYALLNKEIHGALPEDRNNPVPLIFAACEPEVPKEEWEQFCLSVEKKLKGV